MNGTVPTTGDDDLSNPAAAGAGGPAAGATPAHSFPKAAPAPLRDRAGVAGQRGRALLIVNRHSRRGADAADAARAALEGAGLTVARYDALEGKTCTSAVIEGAAQGGIDLVVLGGGDGTLNAGLPGVLEVGLPLGILPLGTANDFARSLGIPSDLDEAARVIADMPPRPVDVGEVNGHHYLNVASIGFSTSLARDLKHESKRRWGVLGYGISALRLLWRVRPFTALLKHDGRTERVRTVQVSVGNGKYHGAGIAVSADARPDSGVLDVYSLEVEHWWELVAMIPWLRSGTQGQWTKVRTFRTTELEVHTRQPRRVNADGELTATTPALFRVHRSALRVFAPPDADAG